MSTSHDLPSRSDLRAAGPARVRGLFLVALTALACSIDDRRVDVVTSSDAGTLRPSGGGSGGGASPESAGGSAGSSGSGAGGSAGSGDEPCLGCLIAERCIGAGQNPDGNVCRVCDPGRDRGAWSAVEGECDDGQFCTLNDVCVAGACVGAARGCDDDVECNGAATCDEAASQCTPGQNQCGDDTFCDVASDACTTTCDGCLVDDICVQHGDELPGNPCRVCDTSRSTAEYSPAPVGTSCGAAATECSGEDTCNAAGVCLANHLPPSTACGALPATCPTSDRCDGNGFCQSRVGQRVEVCDGVDNDCDDITDEGFNLNTDPDNCGSCGHSCLGGTCNAGQCQLRILADLGARQFQLKVVGDTIYSADSGSFNRAVHRLRRDGTSVERNVGLALGGLRSFDVDGSFFYIWRNFSAEIYLTKCDPVTQGASCASGEEVTQQPMTLDRTTSGTSVVVDRAGRRVFWYNFADDSTYASPTGSFSRTRLVGNFANADFIYSNDALWGQDAGDATAVVRVPANGDFPATVAVESSATGFAANQSRVYWISGDHVSFINQPFGNGAAAPNRFNGPVAPRALAVDDTHVYWVEDVGGDVVKRCPVAGCPGSGPVTMTAPIVEALGLAVDDRAVYIAAGTATRVGGQEIPGGVLLIAK